MVSFKLPRRRNADTPRRRILRTLARMLIIGLLFYFIFAALWHNWEELKQHEFSLKWRPIVLSYLIFGTYIFNRALIWQWLTRKFGCAIPLPLGLAAWFYSLLGKYLPGKLFLLAGRLHFYRREKRSALQISMCFMVETICVLLAAILVLLAVPLFADLPIVSRYRTPALALVALFLIAIRPRHLELIANPFLRLARRPPISLPVRYVDMLAVVAVFTLNWTLLGLGFFLFASSLYPMSLRYLLYLAGSFALASTIGILALFAPAGLGVREAILVVALSAIMPQAVAVVVTLASRVWMTLGELMAVGAVALALRLRRKLPALGPPGQEPPGEAETCDDMSDALE